MRHWLSSIVASLYRPPAADAIERLQFRALRRALRNADRSVFHREHGLSAVRSPGEFQARVRIREKSEMGAWWARVAAGENDVVFNGAPRFFALTSGTTGAPERVPVSAAGLADYRAQQREGAFWFVRQRPDTRVLTRATLALGGRARLGYTEAGVPFGLISGIMREHDGLFFMRGRLPSHETTNIDDWGMKLDAIVGEVEGHVVGTMSGIPSILLQFLQHARQTMPPASYARLARDVELLIVSGVDYRPYERQIVELLGHPVEFFNIYVASEGFLGYQDRPGSKQLRLDPSRVFFEFVPWAAYAAGELDRRLLLHQLARDEDYVVAITNRSGAFAYVLGDVLTCDENQGHPLFTIKGRTQLTLSVVGEKVTVTALENAIADLARELGESPSEFVVTAEKPADARPHYLWLIEECPAWARLGEAETARRLEGLLLRRNANLAQYFGTQIDTAEVRFVAAHRFDAWMTARAKQKGHGKVPRIFKDPDDLVLLLRGDDGGGA